MAVENGEWILHGTAWDSPERIRSWRELIDYVDRVGFLPLFQNEVKGFSVEEKTSPLFWWTGDPEQDPWEWRAIVARSGRVAYGKFFNKKAGFISLEWFPWFANYRRDGYDFDARWEDGLAGYRSKKIMDLFEAREEYSSHELKKEAGFGKGGEKNFSGIVTELQMQTYLVTKDFRQKRNRKGQAYGMAASVYAAPEALWWYELVSSAYREAPEKSFQRILDHVRELYPEADEKQLRKVCG